MTLVGSLRAISQAEGSGPVDWSAVVRAAHEATEPGDIDLTSAEQEQYRSDVADARREVRSVTTLSFDLPPTVQILNRHHWIEANVSTFERIMRPLAERHTAIVPELARTVNTGTMSLSLAFLARNVLGQYDPLLLAEEADHSLYFVHPNIQHVATELDVDLGRFRRWIAFHEVAHAAEFGAAPWLSDHLEQHLQSGIKEMGRGKLDLDAFRELDGAMTAVEGYAELIMDRAFDEEYEDLRRKLEERRRRRGPLGRIVRRLLGLEIKRRQYERGKAFFEAVADERGIEAAGAVWNDPASLPEWDEFDAPHRWIDRVDP